MNLTSATFFSVLMRFVAILVVNIIVFGLVSDVIVDNSVARGEF
jgi:hypothetical protein